MYEVNDDGRTNKPAITDHVAKENHVINWSGAKILEREKHQKTRQAKESNMDPERTKLHEQRWSGSTSRDHKPDEARRWRAIRRN